MSAAIKEIDCLPSLVHTLDLNKETLLALADSLLREISEDNLSASINPSWCTTSFSGSLFPSLSPSPGKRKTKGPGNKEEWYSAMAGKPILIPGYR